MRDKGILFAFATALISGIAVFINSLGVSVGDPFVYTMLKNSVVGLFLVSAVLMLGDWKRLLSLDRSQAAKLFAVGIVGGGIPFLFFFYGLSVATAASASFFYRLLFVLAAVIGMAFFRERLAKQSVAGAALALAGSYLIAGDIAFGIGELFVLAAAAFWAVEYAVSKKLLEELPIKLVTCSRMVVGSFVLLLFLALTGRMELVFSVSALQWEWVLVSSAFLTLFVFSWYSALKHAPLSSAAAALTLGGPVTSLLAVAFLGNVLVPSEALGLLLMASGLLVFVGLRSVAGSLALLYEKVKSVLPWKA